MNLSDLTQQKLFLFQSISGSKAYGLDTPQSDTDVRGVFVLPKRMFYSLDYYDQINDARNDTIYYEIKKFVDLLAKNNPNVLELLFTPAECILYEHPLFQELRNLPVLSRLCEKTFVSYAMAQIRKAKGLNKKIVNPMPEKRKEILDFCYVSQGRGSLPFRKWLEKNKYKQEQCGLVNISHMKNVYALFYDPSNTLGYQGVMRKEGAQEVALSSVPKSEKPQGYLAYNKEGYSSYCREYADYWKWVARRNQDRYENTLSHGKNYDAKNMMHTFRLMAMAEEIAREHRILVKRPDREFLLAIKTGKYEYADLLQMAEDKVAHIRELFARSSLPEKPDRPQINKALYTVRSAFYDAHPDSV